MSSEPNALRRTALSLAIVLLFAACGGTGGEAESPEDSDSETSTTEATNGDSTDETATGGEESLSDFFGWGGAEDPEEAEARFRDEEARRQELIRACMAEEGFDYTPVQQPEGSFATFGPDSEEEFVREQGFGITTWYGNEDQFEEEIEDWVDPNQEMVEAMSESEREAYYEALYGTEEEQMEGATTEVDPETGEEFTVMTGYGAGCEGKASEEIYGNPMETEQLWQEIQPAMDAMYERIQADPRIVEWNDEYSACMAEAGYEIESQEVLWETELQDIQERFDEIVGPNGGFADPFEGWTQEEIDAFFEERTEDEIQAFFEEAEEANRQEIDEEALAALQQEEIDLAVANFECNRGFQEIYEEVAADYESEFIAENREILEQIRDAQGG